MAKKQESEYEPRRRRLYTELKSGKIYPAYLIYGDEDYLRLQEKSALLKALGVSEGDMNFTRFSGKGIPADEVIESAQTLPFFAERRVILVEDSGWFAARKKSSSGEETADETGSEPAEQEAGETDEAAQAAGSAEGKKMAAYLKEPSPTTCIIFHDRDVNRTTSLFKAVDKAGFALACDQQSNEVLQKWAISRFRDNGLKIEAAAYARLLELMTGGISNEPRVNMAQMSSEMDKLVSYCYGREAVRVEDVNAVCSDSVMDNVYIMIDQMSAGKREGAMRTYQEMLAMKQAPRRILALIIRQFNGILQAAELAGKRYTNKEIGERLSIHEFVVGKYLGWGRHYTHAHLKQILDMCADYSHAINRGRMNDAVAVEVLIAQITGIQEGTEP